MSTRWNPSLLADSTPSGIAMITEITTAMITWLSVSIASAHMPKMPIAARQQNAKSASVQRRDTTNPRSATAPARYHHGTPINRSLRGTRAYLTSVSLIHSVAGVTNSVTLFTTALTGPVSEVLPPSSTT